jgi:hypothetical protein
MELNFAARFLCVPAGKIAHVLIPRTMRVPVVSFRITSRKPRASSYLSGGKKLIDRSERDGLT